MVQAVWQIAVAAGQAHAAGQNADARWRPLCQGTVGQGLLQHIAGKVGQTRALAARQRDVATVRPALESVHHRCQAR